jgi:predicted DNA-binding transcriptional regulator AlpA
VGVCVFSLQTLSITAVCDALGVSVEELQQWVRRGEFPIGAKLPNGDYRWSAQEVAFWFERSKCLPDSSTSDETEKPEYADVIYQYLSERDGYHTSTEIIRSLDLQCSRDDRGFKQAIAWLKSENMIVSHPTNFKLGYRARSEC